MPVIPTFWRLRQRDYCEFKISLVCIQSSMPTELHSNILFPLPPPKKSHHVYLAFREAPQLEVLFRILGAFPYGRGLS